MLRHEPPGGARAACRGKGRKGVMTLFRPEKGHDTLSSRFASRPRPWQNSERREDRPRHGTGHGSTRQMSAAYSAMVRSLENLPEHATLMIAFRVQASGSVYSAATWAWAWA